MDETWNAFRNTFLLEHLKTALFGIIYDIDHSPALQILNELSNQYLPTEREEEAQTIPEEIQIEDFLRLMTVANYLYFQTTAILRHCELDREFQTYVLWRNTWAERHREKEDNDHEKL